MEYTMKRTSEASLKTLGELIENETQNWMSIPNIVENHVEVVNGVEILLIVLEKWYARTNTNVVISILGTGFNGEQKLNIISTGGSSGWGGLSLGANENFGNKMVSILSKAGFRIIK